MPITERVHYSALQVGDVVVEQAGTRFRVVSEPKMHRRQQYRDRPNTLEVWSVATVAADDESISTYYRPFVTKVGHEWTLQYRSDLAYADREVSGS